MSNVTLPATGLGTATPVIATDTVAAAEHQLIKIEFGAAGAATQVSAANPLPVTASAVTLPTGTATIGDGRQVVTTAGTAVNFASQACKQVTFTALSTNTGVVAIGASTVLAAAGTRRGVPLSAGDSVTLDLSNVNLAFIDSTVNGEGVSFLWEA